MTIEFKIDQANSSYIDSTAFSQMDAAINDGSLNMSKEQLANLRGLETKYRNENLDKKKSPLHNIYKLQKNGLNFEDIEKNYKNSISNIKNVTFSATILLGIVTVVEMIQSRTISLAQILRISILGAFSYFVNQIPKNISENPNGYTKYCMPRRRSSFVG